ncbi:MAG TPA: nickel ABC transporter permease [Thermomicrobiales bacterium]|nr:nickel ABC transporter permease [Thermomicrobiales bacterium]
MGRYILFRLVGSIPVLMGVVIAVFMMVRLVPGDPVKILTGGGARVTQEQQDALRRQLGLDQPLPVQFVSFVGNLSRGDLGTSYRSKRPVSDEIRSRIPNSAKLAGLALLITIVVGVLTGVIASTHKGSLVDLATMFVATIAVSVPGFWFGLMLILFFSVRLGWLPVSGADSWKNLILPAATLGLRSSAVLARVTRSTMLDVLSQDFVRTARAKGLRERIVIYRHALRNALIPIVTLVGLELGALLTGTFIVETVFAYPGLGLLGIQALQTRDFPLIQGIVLVTATIYVVANLCVDVLYGFLDPRIRYMS